MVTRTFGVFAVDRGIFDHPFFVSEPFTEREAWLWMISAAAWKTTRIRSGRKMVWLVRGQLMFSERFLAEKWQWSKSSVRRFIERLQSEAMVTTLSDPDGTLIIICNYEKYAFGGSDSEPLTPEESGPLVNRTRTKEEEGLKNQRIKEEVAAAPAPAPAKIPKRKIPIPIPDDFILTGPRAQEAIAARLDAAATFANFRRWALHTAAVSANWDVRWVMWISKQVEINAKNIDAADEDGRRITHYGDDGLPRYGANDG
ncbi:MAG TPA: hypothetical protein VK577_23975 [Bradyrhizobium sp.]|nr:hypothetical protein [Bradyrhizobium sp.]